MSLPLDAAIDSSRRKASSGGVAAKKSSDLYVAISLTTKRLRIKGCLASPLFTSTHLVPMGALPVACQHAARGARSQTPQSRMNASSSARAWRTRSRGSAAPVVSSYTSFSALLDGWPWGLAPRPAAAHAASCSSSS